MKEIVNRIDKQSFIDLLNEENIKLPVSAIRIGKNIINHQEIIDTLYKAYSYGFDLKENAKFAIQAIYSRAVLYNINADKGFDLFGKLYFTPRVTAEDRLTIAQNYEADPRNYYIPRTMDEIYHQPNLYSVERIQKKIEQTLNSKGFKLENYVNLDHIKGEHTLKNDDDYRLLRLIQLSQDVKNETLYARHETFFEKDFDYETQITEALKANTEKIAKWLRGYEENLELNVHFDKQIGTTITLNGEIYKSNDLKIVLQKDGFVKNREKDNDYMRKINDNERGHRINNNLGTLAVTAFPYLTKDSVSTSTRVPLSDFEKYGKDVVKHMSSPIYRTFATLKDKYYDDKKYNFFFRKNGNNNGKSTPQFSVEFKAENKTYSFVFNPKGEPEIFCERTPIGRKALNKVDPFALAFLDEITEVRDINNAIGPRTWGKEMKPGRVDEKTGKYIYGDKEILDGFGILSDR